MKTPDLADVVAAAERLSGRIHRTSVMSSNSLNEAVGAELFFKCENFQRTGSFKLRGAMNAILQLPRHVSTVVTHSSGNHGAALALAAKECGKSAMVVVPIGARPEKRLAIERLGAEIVDCGENLEDREVVLLRVMTSHPEAVFVPPYDHAEIIAGQGTAALELLEEVGDLDQLWVPVGGGGLAAGTTIVANGQIDVICAEPELARDAHDSLAMGDLQPAMPPHTVADGLRTALGKLNFEILRRNKVAVVLVDDEAIVRAMGLIWNRLKIVVEPSAAVCLAAMLLDPQRVAKRAGIILTGGNISPPGP
ncbi:MAG: pyridoxal-phosphate dependent enzyme [Pseudomonadales bacterium]|jgi:threonine dehydratase